MPLIIDDLVAEAICDRELSARFHEAKIAPGDDEALVAMAPLLAGLYRDRDFLRRRLHEQLELCLEGSPRITATSQTLNLGGLGGGHYLRMVFWPSPRDEFYARCDNSVFYYGKPHDHNFSFLTVGYDGPGYESDYHEIGQPTTDWYPGTEVELRSTGRKQLTPGRLMFYRRHVDVHSQLPPSANSITVNIMSPSSRGAKGSQYIFSAAADRVEQVMQTRFNPVIFEMAQCIADDGVHEQIEHIALHHDDDYVRYYAFRSLAMRDDGQWGARFVDRSERSGSAMLSGWARDYVRRVSQ